MEFCPNGDLQTLLRERRISKRPLAETLILKFFIQTCIGLHALHQQGVLHRDLKAANVFLDSQNDVRIGDFGLARQSRDADQNQRIVVQPHDDQLEIENTSQVGTPLYLAPELLFEATK